MPVLKAYPMGHSGYIATVDIGDNEKGPMKYRSEKLYETIIVLDRSGSMDEYFRKLITKVLPEFFKLLSYNSEDEIHLITFDSRVSEYTCAVREFSFMRMEAGGATYFAPAVTKLHHLLDRTKKDRLVRILTISDGEVFDQKEVDQAGALLYRYCSRIRTRINSQAVRLFTSNTQPDTTALCSLLQINNVMEASLIDILASTPSKEIAIQMAKMFFDDISCKNKRITADSTIFFKNPWDVEATESLWLYSGQNMFWLKKLPVAPDYIRIDNLPLEIKKEPTLTLGKFHTLIDQKLDFIINQLKILKVVGTKEALETVKRMVDHFEQQESFLQKPLVVKAPDSTELSTELDTRFKEMITKGNKRISSTLAELANDNTVTDLNSAQKADYLRQVNLSRNSRGLARRAMKEGLDFDEIARNEVFEMAKHIGKFDGVSDHSHKRSFVSHATTLGGIRFLVNLTKEDAFQSFNVVDILEVFNFVGIACRGPIGDFTDAMVWKIQEIYPDCFVSLSDILSQHEGKPLTVPGTNKEITNVVPLFEDAKIGRFLKKHAPSLLEYSCSIGMRRVIAEVPMTIGYTISNGVWKMIEELDKQKSPEAIDTFLELIETYQMSVGKYFDHINPYLKVQNNGKLSFYTGFNAIPNMIIPLIQIFQQKDEEKLKLIPDILRSLFSYEVWMGVRRLYKHQENTKEIASDLLEKLLGIYLLKYKVKLKPLWEKEPDLEDIDFHDEPSIDYKRMTKFLKPLFYLRYLPLMPKFLAAAANNDTESIRNSAQISIESFMKALGVDYEYKKFLFYSIFQSLAFMTRAERGDVETETMKIADLKYEDEALKEVKNYIRSIYKAQYLADLAKKKKLEAEEVGTAVANEILGAETYSEIIDSWKNGIVRHDVNYKISTPSSPGFKTLIRGLCNDKLNVPQRKNIFKILLLGVDKDENPVWNHGGTCFLYKTDSIQKAFLLCGTRSEWGNLMKIAKIKRKHVYREATNRNGHGNSKPSFWALGYETLEEYQKAVSKADFLKYCQEHKDCCGVSRLDKDFLKLVFR
jgi:hypothetical protein